LKPLHRKRRRKHRLRAADRSVRRRDAAQPALAGDAAAAGTRIWAQAALRRPSTAPAGSAPPFRAEPARDDDHPLREHRVGPDGLPRAVALAIAARDVRAVGQLLVQPGTRSRRDRGHRGVAGSGAAPVVRLGVRRDPQRGDGVAAADPLPPTRSREGTRHRSLAVQAAPLAAESVADRLRIRGDVGGPPLPARQFLRADPRGSPRADSPAWCRCIPIA
jgi:hypothetical protein